MAELKLALVTGVFCALFGAGLIVAGIAVYPIGNAITGDFETKSTGYLNQASSALSTSKQLIVNTQASLEQTKNTVNQALPLLSNSVQDTNNMVSVLNSLGLTFEGMGNSLSAISFLNVSPFGDVGKSMSSVSSSLTQASSSLRNIGNSLSSLQQQAATVPATMDSINNQLESIKSSLSDIQASIDNARNVVPTYFDQARLAVIGLTASVLAFGVVFILVGVSTLSMRKYVLQKQPTRSNNL